MDFLVALINGLSAGGTYAIIALGYTMVYGIAKMLNFAHGDVIMAGDVSHSDLSRTARSCNYRGNYFLRYTRYHN